MTPNTMRKRPYVAPKADFASACKLAPEGKSFTAPTETSIIISPTYGITSFSGPS